MVLLFSCYPHYFKFQKCYKPIVVVVAYVATVKDVIVYSGNLVCCIKKGKPDVVKNLCLVFHISFSFSRRHNNTSVCSQQHTTMLNQFVWNDCHLRIIKTNILKKSFLTCYKCFLQSCRKYITNGMKSRRSFVFFLNFTTLQLNFQNLHHTHTPLMSSIVSKRKKKQI